MPDVDVSLLGEYLRRSRWQTGNSDSGKGRTGCDVQNRGARLILIVIGAAERCVPERSAEEAQRAERVFDFDAGLSVAKRLGAWDCGGRDSVEGCGRVGREGPLAEGLAISTTPDLQYPRRY